MLPPPVALQSLSDERFNQLDELDSQLSGSGLVLGGQISNSSQSILLNCGPGGASSGGELSAINQINNISQNMVENDANVSNASSSNVSSKEKASKVKNAGNNKGIKNANKPNASSAGNCNVSESEVNLNTENSNDSSNTSYCDSAALMDGTPPVLPVLLTRPQLTRSCPRQWICGSGQFLMSPQTRRLRASPPLLPHHLALLGCRVWVRGGLKKVRQPLVTVLGVFLLLLLLLRLREEVKTRKGLKRVQLATYPPVLLVLLAWLLFLESRQ